MVMGGRPPLLATCCTPWMPYLCRNTKRVAIERLLQLVAVNHANVHFVGERGSEDARITHGPCVGGQAVVAATGFSHGHTRQV